FLALAQGQQEDAMFLDATLGGQPGVPAPGRGQSMIATDELNFSNLVVPTSVHGYKFNDLNGNGVDNGDPRLSGWTITLTGTDNMGNPVSLTTTTGANGEYSFTGLTPGTYTVAEVLQTGWTQTAGGTTVTLTSGQ